MSWEKRPNGRLYYYRAARIEGRVVKTYVGRGAAAERAAREDAAKRADRAARRQAEQRQRLADQRIAEQVALVCKEAGAMLEAALLAAGYHRPQRKSWRRRRGKKESKSDA